MCMNYLGYLFAALVTLIFCTCLPVKSLYLGAPDHQDMVRFPHRKIEAGSDCFTFHTKDKQIGDQLKINDWTKDIPFFVSLEELMSSHAVRSFLLIQNDTILYQYAGQNTSPDDLHPSYSIAKSVTATLIGIAIDEDFSR